jgi:hypothetical protein
MMKAKNLVVVLSYLMGCGALTVAAENKSDVKFGVTTDYYSKYIWRGRNINDESVFQPSVYVSACGFTGSIWGNLDLTNSNGNSGEFTEFDYTLGYTAAVPNVESLSFSAGVIHYRFPGTPFNPTTELYGGLTAAVPLSPAIKVYYDVDEIEGAYVQLSVGHTIEKFGQWREDCYCNLQFGAAVGYGTSKYSDGYFGVDNGALNDLTVSGALPICIGRWTIKPSINYSTMLDDDVRAATGKSDNLWGGISALVSF